MKSFIYSMLGNDGSISSKRVIAVISLILLAFVICFTLVKPIDIEHIDYSKFIVVSIIVVILTAAGIATLPEIISLIKGIPTTNKTIAEPEKQPTQTDDSAK